MVLSYEERSQKLRTVAQYAYYHPIDMLLHYRDADIVPGACVNPGCNKIEDVDRHEAHGHCPMCDTDTVQSVLVIAAVA